MAPEVSPEEIRHAEFRTTLRGLDRYEVQAMLEMVAARIEELEAENRKLTARLAEAPPPNDLSSEFDTVGKEVTVILQAARDAAESMRERATIDAARWRREATEEADTTRKEAAADAEALRRDAWVTSSEMLEQTQVQAEAMRASAERDVLTVMGEAEREAHRLTSGARREAEDLVRNATMDAEKITADATKRRDEIIDAANRQASTAQERARALELRRDELLEELENVRATLTRLEGSLEERRESLDLTKTPPENTSVRVVHPPADAKKQWELGETVRVVPPGGKESPESDSEIGDDFIDEATSRLSDPEITESEPSMTEPDPVPAVEDEPTPEPEPPTPPPLSEPDSKPEPDDHEVKALFASLRSGENDTPAAGDPRAEDASLPADGGVRNGTAGEESEGTDWIAVRDSRLLPITNRALRGVKKAMTEVQNVALDSLRTEEEWEPDPDAIAESIHAELVAVWSESFAAGHSVAEEMEGNRLKRPGTPSSHADREFAFDLATAVTNAVQQAGDGPRERQSAASRVFRVWRSDEAERRIRDIAVLGYETGIEKSRRVKTG